VAIGDFDRTGFVALADGPKYKPLAEVKFKTESGKLEMVNNRWDSQGLPSLKPYESPEAPPEGTFRLTFGRCGVHTQGHTVNNPLLNEQMSENVLWLNKAVAARLGIASGDAVEVSTAGDPAAGAHAGTLKAFVTEFIHPEAVFMVHGFGHKLPVETRAYGKGVADQELMPGGMDKFDPAGGALALQEHFVRVRKV
jgi:thiosulfate reductase/polysulfide reductase chain A